MESPCTDEWSYLFSFNVAPLLLLGILGEKEVDVVIAEQLLSCGIAALSGSKLVTLLPV